MPKSPNQSVSWFVGLCFLAVPLGLLALPGLLWWPLAFVLPVWMLGITLLDRRRNNRFANAREGESICEFASAFDLRSVDPWIVRAVYEEFSRAYPIRPTDSFETDLRIDDEDLEDSIVDIAKRVGRSLDNIESNPWYEKINRVEGLVLALQYQPKSLAVE